MIFEIFNAIDGKTLGHRFGEERAKQTCDRIGSYVQDGENVVPDYLPAEDGFFVLDMRDNVKAGPFTDHSSAQAKADIENQSTDANSFHVYRQEI